VATRLNAAEGDVFNGMRKQERTKLVMPCVMHYFAGADGTMKAANAATRNISTGGISLLVERPMVRGEAVEVVLNRGSVQLFLAGLVAFCRHIDRSLHEVGIQFVVHSVTPVISGDTPQALKKYDWVARALGAKHSGNLDPQVTV
jgi:hypothetical protein